MAVSFRLAREAAGSAIRSFSLHGYMPLLVVLILQVLYLVLGLNLGSTVGMATAGLLARMFVGPSALEYPAFLQLLPVTFSYVETVTFILIGAWALPLVAARILAGGDAASRAAAVRRAFAPTFVALLLVFVLSFVWQVVAPPGLRALLSFFIHGGFEQTAATWTVSTLVGYAMTTLVVYVPIVAVAEKLSFASALRDGVRLGWQRFWVTYPIALLFFLPSLMVQLLVQVLGSFLTNRTRPENLAYLLLLYAVLGSIGTYALWSTATRVHRDEEVSR